MITIQILEAKDKVRPDDWCRPLQIVSMNGGHSDHYSFESQYSGRPENNAKWVHVSEAFGECWVGHAVGKICSELGEQYEFARGDIPVAHQYGKTKRQLREEYELYLSTPVTFGKYKARLSPAQILQRDPDYYRWAEQTGLFKRLDDFDG